MREAAGACGSAREHSAGSGVEQRRRRAIQQFLRPQLLQFFLNAAQRAFAGKFRRAKLAGGKIERGETHAVSDLRQRGQKIIFFRTERRIRRGAGRDDTRDFAPHQLSWPAADLPFARRWRP